jgi:type I restriction enzyme, R subunit
MPLSEEDIKTQYITPAITRAGWDLHSQVRQEVYLTKGRIPVRGKIVYKGEEKYADYILFHMPQIPLAIIEAKDGEHAIGGGMQQALEYAEMANVPFVFSAGQCNVTTAKAWASAQNFASSLQR